jgi:hypothetical protein
MNERPRTKFTMTVNDQKGTITLPFPKNVLDTSYERIRRDVERIQWLSIGYGGIQENEEIKFSFEQEEFNCVVRYLTKFEWVKNTPG